MTISISPDERLAYLVTICGSLYKTLYTLHETGDDVMKQRVMDSLSESMGELEIIMDLYGIPRNPEGVATAMMLTEDLIGCEPKGKLLSVSATEAVRKVTSCPWAPLFSQNGKTCRFIMDAVQEGLGEKHGLRISCEQSIAEGKECCIWKVTRNL